MAKVLILIGTFHINLSRKTRVVLLAVTTQVMSQSMRRR
jgi:hypothetical protein